MAIQFMAPSPDGVALPMSQILAKGINRWLDLGKNTQTLLPAMELTP